MRINAQGTRGVESWYRPLVVFMSVVDILRGTLKRARYHSPWDPPGMTFRADRLQKSKGGTYMYLAIHPVVGTATYLVYFLQVALKMTI